MFSSFRKIAFYHPDGSRVDSAGQKDPTLPGRVNPDCQISPSVVVDLASGQRNAVCAGQSLFEDEFSGLNDSRWRTLEQFSRSPVC